MAFTSTAIEQGRYITDTKRLLIEFFDYYLNGTGSGCFGSSWANVKGGRVAVQSTRTKLKMDDGKGEDDEDAGLKSPLLMLMKTNETTDYASVAAGQYVNWGEGHRMSFMLVAITDGATGRGITCDDISSAVGKILAEHRHELEQYGLRVDTVDDGMEEDDPPLYANRHGLHCEVLLYGPVLATLPLELADFTFTAPDTGDFLAGVELEVPQLLRLRMVTGATASADIEVYVENQDGDPKTLTGTIPANCTRETLISLVALVESDRYTKVTGIAVTGGQAGTHFKVMNIPIQY